MMKRAILALVDESSFDVKEGTFNHRLACYTVLAGDASQIDAVRDSASVANSGPWVTNPAQIKEL
jgi:hypothetical protein